MQVYLFLPKKKRYMFSAGEQGEVSLHLPHNCPGLDINKKLLMMRHVGFVFLLINLLKFRM
jgi:hypothetical protein